ncbi:MAG: PSD1 domain-containing protein [Planctomycetes bacterium]|nr:PSD1 domain-containing protein [Planctomycetota bacterium]
MLLRISTWGLLVVAVLAGQASAAPPVDFQRDVQPILAEHCTLCHGVDPADRKSGLRLDLRDAALKGGESGEPAIVPGDPEKSPFIERIKSTDPGQVMPPPKHQKPLSPRQIETLTQWIREGAKYESHWAFTAPQKATPPAGGPAHPIDAFVAGRLKDRQLTLSPQADPATLCRRLYLDLLGLPPTPAELAQFQKDGYEATVEKLLASERFGEKWARHWLDAARYSDSNGYEKDMPREQWKWRDWVVDALNRDMPYDQFLIQQIAGDLLPPSDQPGGTQQQVIATGFLRNSMINEEGAIIPEQFRMVEMIDRMDCIGKAILGLSTQCAQCHSHKFDPLTQTEYYGMFAFLNTSYEARSWVYTVEQERQIADIRAKLAAVEQRWREMRPQWQQELADWEARLTQQQPVWESLLATELGTLSGLNHPTQEADLSLLMLGHSSNDVFMITSPALDGVTGLRLEALTHRDLPHQGPGRSGVGTWGMNELEVLIKKPDGKDWEKLKLVNATADFSQPLQKQPDGKKASGPVAHLIDGTDETTWNTDRGVGRRNQASVAVVQFEQPIQAPAGSQLKIVWRMTDMLGCARFSLTRSPAPVAAPVDHAAILALQVPFEQRTVAQRDLLFDAWLAGVPEAKPIAEEIEALWKSYPQAPTSILHLAEQEPARRRKTHFLDRGNWDQPLQEIQPHTPAAFHPYPADAPRDRLGFARWLADRRSPLTARVAVNRIWQAIFGTGLVETAEDLGTRAPVPEYRELLDWLAVDLMDRGWSQKAIIRMIVTSAVYKQSSAASAELLEQDPRNVWLARGPRFRADAEVVRDIALSVSGLLTEKMGGPP